MRKRKRKRLTDLRTEHEAARALYDADVARRNAEVDAFQQAYNAHEPDAVVAYNDMVLTRSEYPAEGFPQSFKLAYAEESKELVIEYDLPEVSVIPAESDYRYVKTRMLSTPRRVRQATSKRSTRTSSPPSPCARCTRCLKPTKRMP